jgi:GNAT superfamily N-acetyltransferase
VEDFRASHDPGRERAWVAELDGARVGMVMLVRLDDATAKLRILLVEPGARGRGIGSALVAECIDFARGAGYDRITLWTDSGLDPARHIYLREGFRRVRSEPHDLYGEGLVAETWEKGLGPEDR